MRYTLTEDEADPARLLRAPRYDHTVADIVGADDGGPAAVLRDFVEGLQPRYLDKLRRATLDHAGFGHELAGSTYDDDLDPDEERFEGVRITANYRPDDVVMSRAAYERLVDALVARVP